MEGSGWSLQTWLGALGSGRLVLRCSMGGLYCASHLSDLKFSWDQEVLIEHGITCYSSEPLGSQVEVTGNRKTWRESWPH